MFGKQKAVTPKVEQAVARAVNFEMTVADLAKRSERRAWAVAWCAILMSLLLAGGYFLFLPLKEKVPYLVVADPYTGTASVARLVGNFRDRTVTAEEAINKSNVSQFVLARESYDSGLVGQINWRTVLSMAGPAVAPAYIALHSDSNTDRPYKLYGTDKAVRTRILSIVLVGGGNGKPPSGATVRFQRSLYEKSGGQSTPLDSKVATLEFAYNPDLQLDDEDRLLNPLGFRVTNYRVDSDFAAPIQPPPEFPVAPAASPVAAPVVPAPAPGSVAAPDQIVPNSTPAAAATAPAAPQTPATANPANGVSTR